MKPCPDCQCKNQDTATSCGWCARDVTDVAAIPGPEPAKPLPPFWTDGKRAILSWFFVCLAVAFYIRTHSILPVIAFVSLSILPRMACKPLPEKFRRWLNRVFFSMLAIAFYIFWSGKGHFDLGVALLQLIPLSYLSIRSLLDFYDLNKRSNTTNPSEG